MAGGAVGGLIVLGVLIWCCSRRCCGGGRDGGGGGNGGWFAEHNHHHPRTTPRSEDQMYWLVKDVFKPDDWQAVYTHEARRIAADNDVDRAAWMADFASRAVAARVQQLRKGGQRTVSMLKAGFWGLIPFGSAIASIFWDSTKNFRELAVDAVGLGGSAQIADLRARAKAATDDGLLATLGKGAAGFVGTHATEYLWNHADFAAALQQGMVNAVAGEFGAQAGQEFSNQLVHLKPFVGQVFSATFAAWSCDDKMLRALQWLEPVALDHHREVFVVNALADIAQK